MKIQDLLTELTFNIFITGLEKGIINEVTGFDMNTKYYRIVKKTQTVKRCGRIS